MIDLEIDNLEYAWKKYNQECQERQLIAIKTHKLKWSRIGSDWQIDLGINNLAYAWQKQKQDCQEWQLTAIRTHKLKRSQIESDY